MGLGLPVRETFWIGEDFDLYLVRLRYESDGPSWIDFEIFDVVVSRDLEGNETREFDIKDSHGGPGNWTTNADEAETLCEGFVKWDGCTQWSVSGAHTDGKDSLRFLCEAIQRSRARCIEIMGAQEYE